MIHQSFSHHRIIEGIAVGVYFYRLRVGDPSLHSGQWFVETKKLLLVK